MKKAIKVKPSDIVIVCAPGCNCDRKRAKTTTNLADQPARVRRGDGENA